MANLGEAPIFVDLEIRWIVLIPTLLGAIGAVFNMSESARSHQALARRFFDVAKSIDVNASDLEKNNKCRISLLEIYEDEPPVYHALNAECANAASKALGHKEGLKKIAFWRRWLRHLWRFTPEKFPVVS